MCVCLCKEELGYVQPADVEDHMVKDSDSLSAKRRWHMPEVVWSIHHMHSALDGVGKARTAAVKYVTHQQLTAIVAREPSKNNACWAAGTVWVPFHGGTQGADIHLVWRVYKHRNLFRLVGTLTVSPEGFPLWSG